MLRVQRLHPGAVVPARAHDGDAGLDLCALERAELAPGARARVRTGIAIELPPGHAGLVLPRSGLAHRHGIALVNAPGLIDEGYRGEVQVLLLNTDREAAFLVEPGMRIAQLVLVAVAAPPVVEVEALGETVRGAGGFGSSGPLTAPGRRPGRRAASACADLLRDDLPPRAIEATTGAGDVTVRAR